MIKLTDLLTETKFNSQGTDHDREIRKIAEDYIKYIEKNIETYKESSIKVLAKRPMFSGEWYKIKIWVYPRESDVEGGFIITEVRVGKEKVGRGDRVKDVNRMYVSVNYCDDKWGKKCEELSWHKETHTVNLMTKKASNSKANKIWNKYDGVFFKAGVMKYLLNLAKTDLNIKLDF